MLGNIIKIVYKKHTNNFIVDNGLLILWCITFD